MIRHSTHQNHRNSMWGLAVLLQALLFISSATAFYGKGSAVQLASAKTFSSLVLNHDLPVLVEFFAPWWARSASSRLSSPAGNCLILIALCRCGHCQQLTPTYEKVAANMAGIAPVVAVDCDDVKNKGICSRYAVQGFPTLKAGDGATLGRSLEMFAGRLWAVCCLRQVPFYVLRFPLQLLPGFQAPSQAKPLHKEV